MALVAGPLPPWYGPGVPKPGSGRAAFGNLACVAAVTSENDAPLVAARPEGQVLGPSASRVELAVRNQTHIAPLTLESREPPALAAARPTGQIPSVGAGSVDVRVGNPLRIATLYHGVQEPPTKNGGGSPLGSPTRSHPFSSLMHTLRGPVPPPQREASLDSTKLGDQGVPTEGAGRAELGIENSLSTGVLTLERPPAPAAAGPILPKPGAGAGKAELVSASPLRIAALTPRAWRAPIDSGGDKPVGTTLTGTRTNIVSSLRSTIGAGRPALQFSSELMPEEEEEAFIAREVRVLEFRLREELSMIAQSAPAKTAKTVSVPPVASSAMSSGGFDSIRTFDDSSWFQARRPPALVADVETSPGASMGDGTSPSQLGMSRTPGMESSCLVPKEQFAYERSAAPLAALAEMLRGAELNPTIRRPAPWTS